MQMTVEGRLVARIDRSYKDRQGNPKSWRELLLSSDLSSAPTPIRVDADDVAALDAFRDLASVEHCGPVSLLVRSEKFGEKTVFSLIGIPVPPKVGR